MAGEKRVAPGILGPVELDELVVMGKRRPWPERLFYRGLDYAQHEVPKLFRGRGIGDDYYGLRAPDALSPRDAAELKQTQDEAEARGHKIMSEDPGMNLLVAGALAPAMFVAPEALFAGAPEWLTTTALVRSGLYGARASAIAGSGVNGVGQLMASRGRKLDPARMANAGVLSGASALYGDVGGSLGGAAVRRAGALIAEPAGILAGQALGDYAAARVTGGSNWDGIGAAVGGLLGQRYVPLRGWVSPGFWRDLADATAEETISQTTGGYLGYPNH